MTAKQPESSGPGKMSQRSYYPYSVVVLAVVCAAYFFSTMVRNDISTVTPQLIAGYSWSSPVVGWVNSSYVWAYAIMQIPFGYISEGWWGARSTLTVGVLLIAVGGITFAVALPNVVLSILSRILMGAGSAAILVPANPALSRWFTSARRGIQSAIIGVGGAAGIFVGNALTPFLIGGSVLLMGLSSIQSGFLVLAIPIVFVTAIVFLLMRDKPEDVGLQPLDSASGGASFQGDLDESFVSVMTHSTTPYLLTIVYSGYIGCTGGNVWFTLYFVRAYSLDTTTAALLFALITLIPTVLGQLIGGMAGDRIGHRTLVSSWTLASGLVMAAIAILVALFGTIQLVYLVGLLCAFVLFSAGWVNAWPLTTELFSGKVAGPVGGLMNTGGNITMAVAIVAGGYFISTMASFAFVFALSSALAMAGFIGTLFLPRSQRHTPKLGPKLLTS